ncbi:hypothetical protein KAU19_06910 [Candidatus Parcubacteria bacterium]|nr:hypothetical protein [Candidatus Parcubacteria bacterium]
MHIYIYDSFVNQKKYNKILARIETRITDLGLNGKISRLGLMKNIPDLVENELKRGAKTIIAVGNDKTVNQVINSLAGGQIPLGIIPVGKDNNLIATALGIEPEEAACDILSARRIINLDLGKANNQYFLTNAVIDNQNTIIEMDKDYSIEIMEQGRVNIINLAARDMDLPKNAKFNPQDGVLELFISTKQSKYFLKKIIGQSIFPFKKLTIINKRKPVILDGVIRIPAPVEISVAGQMLNVIVGKERGF